MPGHAGYVAAVHMLHSCSGFVVMLLKGRRCWQQLQGLGRWGRAATSIYLFLSLRRLPLQPISPSRCAYVSVDGSIWIKVGAGTLGWLVLQLVLAERGRLFPYNRSATASW
jgi:hypothetical protein